MGTAKEKLSAALENPELYTRGLDAGTDLLRDSKKAAMSTLTAAHGNSFGNFLKADWLPIAGTAAAVAFVGNLFSASDDEYNTIEGLKHAGFAGATRKLNTDFGSGWRGLKEVGEALLGAGDHRAKELMRLNEIGEAHLDDLNRLEGPGHRLRGVYDKAISKISSPTFDIVTGKQIGRAHV